MSRPRLRKGLRKASSVSRVIVGKRFRMRSRRPAPPPAAWYADPTARHQYRFWDGSRWWIANATWDDERVVSLAVALDVLGPPAR